MTKYIIVYEGKNINENLSGKLISLKYEDKLEGRASSLELSIQDNEKLFAGDWYPQVGDHIKCAMGIEGAPLLDCGGFYVDEFSSSMSRSGIITTLKALSVPAEKIHSTPFFKNYVGKKFSEVAKEVGQQLGYKIEGELNEKINQNTQRTGLSLLFQLSKIFGYVMKIEGDTINFIKYETLKTQQGFRVVFKDMISCHITDKAQGRYNKCTLKWWDAKKKIMISGAYSLGIQGGGEMTIWEEVEDSDKAQNRAKSWLENKQKERLKITINLIGNIKILAGVPIELVGIGKNDGKYITKESTHTITRNGYFTEIILIK